MRHPLARLVADASRGRFPDVDGDWSRCAPWRPGVEAVVAFTGHAVLAVADDVTDARLEKLGVDGFGRAHDHRVLGELVGPHGWADSLDAVLVAEGVGRGPGDDVSTADLVPAPELHDHPRVRHAASLRDDVRAWSTPDGEGLVTLSRGLGGLAEVGVEVRAPGRGRGRALAAAARHLVPAGDVLVAAVAPGNAASLRAFLAAGYAPVASVQVYVPGRATDRAPTA